VLTHRTQHLIDVVQRFIAALVLHALHIQLHQYQLGMPVYSAIFLEIFASFGRKNAGKYTELVKYAAHAYMCHTHAANGDHNVISQPHLFTTRL